MRTIGILLVVFATCACGGVEEDYGFQGVELESQGDGADDDSQDAGDGDDDDNSGEPGDSSEPAPGDCEVSPSGGEPCSVIVEPPYGSAIKEKKLVFVHVLY